MARNGTFSGLSARQQQAIICLLSEPNIAAAAEQAHVGRRTLFRWLRESAFQEAYTAAKHEAFAQAMALARANCGKAVKFLVDLVDDAEAPLSPRVQAAKTIIDFARSETIEEIESRVEQLERVFDRRHGERPNVPF